MSEDDSLHFTVICEVKGRYGLTVCDKNGKEIFRCRDIMGDNNKLCTFADTCNRCKVSAVHISDLIEDFMD